MKTLQQSYIFLPNSHYLSFDIILKLYIFYGIDARRKDLRKKLCKKKIWKVFRSLHEEKHKKIGEVQTA